MRKTTAALAVAAGLASAGPAHAATHHIDPSWRDAPAWTTTIAPMHVRAIPPGVCPFGFSDLAAYRASGARVDRLAAFYPGRAIVSGSRATLRVYVWCG